MLKAWLNFFRVVNLPTVPGDVLVGASIVLYWGDFSTLSLCHIQVILAASIASIFLYLFGLADNDIVGATATTDSNRPIPKGEISLTAARLARGFCLFVVLLVGSLMNLQANWWIAAFLLLVCSVVYNRTKWCVVMGLCRGLNVFCGACALGLCDVHLSVLVLAVAVIWTLYIAAVTKYSKGEDMDPEKKHRVGFLIGALVYLQILALLVFRVDALLLTGAALLIILRLMKRLLPGVSAS